MLPFRVYGDIALTHYRKVEVTSAKKAMNLIISLFKFYAYRSRSPTAWPYM